MPGGPDRVREVHDLPGIGRVRRHGSLPEPTCRHGGCPLRRLKRPVHQYDPYVCHNTSRHITPIPSVSTSVRTATRTALRIAAARQPMRYADTGHRRRSPAHRFRDQPSPCRDGATKPGRVTPPQLPHQARHLALCVRRSVVRGRHRRG
ncbi:hypothetical protein STRTUCAR8_06627 [Streptomyces turgidiscabies Car8]|uniref:Uncharacterized protein n=1 Tax=Streptomyces turgidiscabies (strain Car8) TaxID=698760 RepID=L7EYZ6_STRT8|nr:hypothetical protein STRTUCAR8_06627 [Streptomyces turgidiscabies Car8]